MYYLLKEEFDLKQLWDLVKRSACLLNHVWCWNLKSTGQAIRKERWTQIMGRSRSSRPPISMRWDSMKTNCNLDFHGFPACQCGWAAAAGAFSPRSWTHIWMRSWRSRRRIGGKGEQPWTQMQLCADQGSQPVSNNTCAAEWLRFPSILQSPKNLPHVPP